MCGDLWGASRGERLDSSGDSAGCPLVLQNQSVVVEGPPGRVGRVLGLLEPFLELAVEQLALLPLRLQLLAEAGLPLGGAGVERADGGAEIGHAPLARRVLVGDDSAQLGIDREFSLAAREGDDEADVSNDVLTVEGGARRRKTRPRASEGQTLVA